MCETFACADDLNTLENFVYGDTPTAAAIDAFLHDLFAQADDFDVSLSALSRAHDLRELVARTLLTYLELLGYLQGGTPFYASYRFRPKMASEEILARFQGPRRQFLAALLRRARKAKTWFDLDVEGAAAGMGQSRERIVAALDYLGEQDLLEVTAAGVRHRFRIVQRPDNVAELSAKLYERALRREENELARLRQVLELIEANSCQVAALSTHFGERREPCGHCSWCLDGGKPARMPARRETGIDPAVWTEAAALRQEHPQVLGHARVMARFLCGISSPSLSKAKLTGHALFGRLAQVPFAAVKEHGDNVSDTYFPRRQC